MRELALSWSALVMLLLSSWSCVETNQGPSKNGNLFYYLDLAQRLQTLSTIETAIQSKYALLDIKEERISLDLEQIFHSARNLEKQYPNTDRDFYQAVSNLWFFDRLSLLIAKFQDTHLQIQPLMEMPHIRLGIEIVPLANGNYMLSSIDSNLQNKLEKQGVSLEVGDLIYEVNDLAIHEEVAKLQKYIPSSSKNYAFTKAVQSLTSRNFKYPKSPRMKITYRNGSGEIKKANLKWTYTYNYKRSDALYYLDYLGFEFRWHDSSDGNNQHPPISDCLLYTSPSPRDLSTSRMPSSA